MEHAITKINKDAILLSSHRIAATSAVVISEGNRCTVESGGC